MTWFDRLVTKKNVFLFSLIGPLVFLIASLYFHVCAYGTGCEKYFDPIGYLIPLVLIFFPVLFFSLITFRMRAEIFRAWMKFAIWWVPVTVFLTLIAPNDTSQSLPMPSTKGLVDLALIFIFVVVSIIVIAQKMSSLKKNQ